MARGDSYQLQGQEGGVVLKSTSSEADGAGPFRWLLVVNDAVLSEIGGNIRNGSDLVGPTLPAGLSFGGVLTSITVSSGLVIAYDQ